MEEKELVIDAYTKLRKIKNKEEITKLELCREVSNRFLSSFPNVKSLTISTFGLNDRNLNKMIFIENVENIKFKDICFLGCHKNLYYSLKSPNLKSIELPSNLIFMNKNYLERCHLLEEIILNIVPGRYDRGINVKDTSLKEILINYKNSSYKINPDYKTYRIISYGIDIVDEETFAFLQYGSDIYETRALIKDNEIYKQNILRVLSKTLVKDGCFYIPDFVDVVELKGYDNIPKDMVKSISINTKILDSDKQLICLYPGCLEKIILRNDNDMKLFNSKEIDVSGYGIATHVSIKKNKLVIQYGKKFVIMIDSEGNLKKILPKNSGVKRTEDKTHELDKYTTKEIVDYLCCKRLLEFMKELDLDNKVKDAILDTKDKLVKSLKNR